jgi:carbonic anhydrase
MAPLRHLFENNRRWADAVRQAQPDFFERLSHQQEPDYLWIGCSDSRVPSNQIVDLMPGELFVHRNVANVVVHTDLNCLSVLQFAVDVLGVEHAIVCGHYGCGGVEAALRGTKMGLTDNWLRHVQDVAQKHGGTLAALPAGPARTRRLCELNVIEQVVHVAQTTVVQDAWGRGQSLAVHGWVYDVGDGLLQDLDVCVTSAAELEPAYARACRALGR